MQVSEVARQCKLDGFAKQCKLDRFAKQCKLDKFAKQCKLVSLQNNAQVNRGTKQCTS